MDINFNHIWKVMTANGPAVTILVFVATQILTKFFEFNTARTQRKRLVRALFCEVVFNTEGLQDYQMPPLPEVQDKLRTNPSFRPHVIYAVHTKFYDGNVSGLLAFDGKVVGLLLAFYESLESIRADTAGFNAPSFLTISDEGRVKKFVSFVDTIHKTTQLGVRTLVLVHDQHRNFFRGFRFPEGEEYGRASESSSLDYYIERRRLEINQFKH